MEVSQYDHLRPGGDEYEAGIYRVVDSDERPVALLSLDENKRLQFNAARVVAVDRRVNFDVIFVEIEGCEPRSNRMSIAIL